MKAANSQMPQHGRRTHDVAVQQYTPDINDLAWSTLCHLFPLAPSPGREKDIMASFAFFMGRLFVLGESNTVFANPAYAVRASHASRHFIKKAEQAQLAWLKQCKSFLFSS